MDHSDSCTWRSSNIIETVVAVRLADEQISSMESPASRRLTTYNFCNRINPRRLEKGGQ